MASAPGTRFDIALVVVVVRIVGGLYVGLVMMGVVNCEGRVPWQKSVGGGHCRD